ncbi:hypothetical protein JYK14_22590 [Siccirubricoccus sp. KC 17139]|uniref:Uncharacterized protein n=1 Tax=Siccirubricoccus soli TaxID=2899147 RepID=A0ABT1DAM0_9PROT|nr:hypothetical protein [Siccirubricoccus soli]MCO6418924.1 hypothetical protein [Siccirubricoccus soli]MCP2685059.1 hypothetical protein [Siccirubricoccus soli]
MAAAFDTGLFGREGGYAVRIMDLSGGNGAEPVETIRGFQTLEHANAFARRYVRDSVERCRNRGMSPEQVLAAWFAFGEDAEVVGGAEQAWRSAAELNDFAARPARDAEDRNWRALDPRRDEEDEEEE